MPRHWLRTLHDLQNCGPRRVCDEFYSVIRRCLWWHFHPTGGGYGHFMNIVPLLLRSDKSLLIPETKKLPKVKYPSSSAKMDGLPVSLISQTYISVYYVQFVCLELKPLFRFYPERIVWKTHRYTVPWVKRSSLPDLALFYTEIKNAIWQGVWGTVLDTTREVCVTYLVSRRSYMREG